jgi:hypothetical protein
VKAYSAPGAVRGAMSDYRASAEDVAQGLWQLIPSPIDQNPCAHWRKPMDMMRQG